MSITAEGPLLAGHSRTTAAPVNPLKQNRLASVDILRALTMLLMIFVNDLWSLTNVPGWLEHTQAAEDGMGLADTVFPAFLFIVGITTVVSLKKHIKEENKMLLYRSIFARALLFVRILL